MQTPGGRLFGITLCTVQTPLGVDSTMQVLDGSDFHRWAWLGFHMVLLCVLQTHAASMWQYSCGSHVASLGGIRHVIWALLGLLSGLSLSEQHRRRFLWPRDL